MTLLKVIVLSSFLKNNEIYKDLIQNVGLPITSFTVFSGDIKKKSSKNGKKALKMTS